ncbi:long-chain acyl-CoA synthetase [Mobilisporobacter senegalensis]|uniref:Long-chain acyl-CoA synthetase n=1 Tax=Mobilisporobacter senegalensis TaxID=1329262 RepID=A0A3N1XGM6_9FIRM|nr:AMP-binding protein [Mobilisporobacter senegalensis]ROR25866.1 long-chain acyl-CoA synthetase [Mobilisporobacter senegalensis]
MKGKDYPKYEPYQPLDLKDLVRNQVSNNPSHMAFEFYQKKEYVTKTYQEFQDDIINLGTFFYANLLKDSKIAIIGENSYEWIVSYFATVIGSNVVVPIDKDLSIQEIYNITENSGVEAIVYSDDYGDVAEELQTLSTKIRCYFNMKNMNEYREKGQGEVQQKKTFIDNEIDPDQLCTIIYTSGTTGKPKGVMLSNRNLASNVAGSCQNVLVTESSMLVLPLHHTFAFTTSILCMLNWGIRIPINSSLKKFNSDLKQFKPYCMFLVPMFVETMYKRIWEVANEKKITTKLKWVIGISNCLRRIGIDIRRLLFKQIIDQFGGNLGLIVSGGAFLEGKYIKGFEELGITVLNGYGISECSPVVAVNRNQYYSYKSVGLPLVSNEVKIGPCDQEGNGPILVKGPNVMLGYYKDEQATNNAICDGWFNTGDIGYLDSKGFLYITGREKNLIILSNGKNIYPEEIEAELMNCEWIHEVIVYGQEDRLHAAIFSELENQDAVRKFINTYNHGKPVFKQIQSITFREEEFKKTTTKKIIRNFTK